MVNLQPPVSVEWGDGLVARFGDVVVFVAQADQSESGIEEILQSVESAASDGSSGTQIATQLAGLVAGRGEGELPAFGVLAPLGEGYVVLLRGPVWAEIFRHGGNTRLSGEQAVTWVDRKVEESFDSVSIGSGEPPIQPDPRSDLRAGVVAGRGFVLTSGALVEEPAAAAGGPATVASREARPTEAPVPAPEVPAASDPVLAEPAPEPAPAPAGTAGDPARATIVPPAVASADQPEAESRPEAVMEPEPTAAALETVPPAGEGVTAQRAPAGATVMVTRPVGFLVAEDGLRIPLDRAYVLGREPEEDPAVASGTATPIRLNDEDNLISRVQSHIAVKDGQVLLRDAGSSNGTYVAKPGDEDWTRVGADAVTLRPEWSMRVGKLVFTHVVTGDPS